jgi:hypothetical protein
MSEKLGANHEQWCAVRWSTMLQNGGTTALGLDVAVDVLAGLL